jgi:hypothetical protein
VVGGDDMDAEQAVEKAREFLQKSGFTYFFLESVEHLPTQGQWKVVASAALFSIPKELLIDDTSGKILKLTDRR